MTTAFMLAAGAGSRLQPEGAPPPKVLLRFAGRSLLERHVEILRHFGVDGLVMVVGYRAEAIAAEVQAIGAGDFVRLLDNPRWREDGSMGSLWRLSEALEAAAGPALLMDADVLYDRRLMARLIDSRHANCVLLDDGVDRDEDPLRVCLKDGRIVDFHKRPSAAHDWQGRWIGFLRYSPAMARLQRRMIEPYVEAGRFEAIYEEPMRDLMVAGRERFGYEDVGDLPWIEIDFPEDLVRAERKILPALEPLAG